jgi:Spore germination B3/ GerAC like, C-terminal.
MPRRPEKASDRRRIEAELTAAVKRLAEAAVRRAQQELRVDYLRLREELRRALPAAAEELDWKQTFPAVRVDVDVRMAAGGVVFPGESLRTVPYD